MDGFLAFYHFGICCVYVVFIAESIKQLVDEYLVVWDVRIHMCILVVPLLLIFCIRNLKLLAPFSSAANLLLFVGESRHQGVAYWRSLLTVFPFQALASSCTTYSRSCRR